VARRVWRAAQTHQCGLSVGAPHSRDRLDDDQHVDDPVVEQDAPLLGTRLVPRCREVARLVDDRLEALPGALLGLREQLRLLQVRLGGTLPLLGRAHLLAQLCRRVVIH
jgi:hypothetical protein